MSDDDAAPEMRYPLHEKLLLAKDTALLLTDLYDKLKASDIVLARYVKYDEFTDERLAPAHFTGDDFVGLALNIDPKVLSAEKDQMVADLRRAHERRAEPVYDPNRTNPEPHWRLYRSPRDERICAICVQDFDYVDYIAARFITHQAFDNEDDAIAAIARLPRRVIDGTDRS